jgi:NADPH-dependent curcumin reductase CurA
MPVCGLISSYNDEGSIAGPKDFGNILMRRLTIKGFIVSDYLARFPEALAELVPLVVSGRLKWKTHVVEGIENAPEAVNLMFSGANDGKLLVRVSPDP